MNTSRAGSNMPCSRIQRRRARATSARFCSAACRLFFEADRVPLEEGHTALRLPAIRRLRIAATISSSVKSGRSAINTSKKSACASRGEMLPPLGLGAILPVSCCRCIHLMAELGLTANHSAASRRDAPDAMASTTRSRNSKEHGFGIDPPPKIELVPPDFLIQTIPGNTDLTQVKSALTLSPSLFVRRLSAEEAS